MVDIHTCIALFQILTEFCSQFARCADNQYQDYLNFPIPMRKRLSLFNGRENRSNIFFCSIKKSTTTYAYYYIILRKFPFAYCHFHCRIGKQKFIITVLNSMGPNQFSLAMYILLLLKFSSISIRTPVFDVEKFYIEFVVTVKCTFLIDLQFAGDQVVYLHHSKNGNIT